LGPRAVSIVIRNVAVIVAMSPTKELEAFYRSANYPLVSMCDMDLETREEAIDICVTAIEKFQKDLEKATQVTIKPHKQCLLGRYNLSLLFVYWTQF
jgi:hypothetical protein